MENIFKTIAHSFSEQKIKHVLIGGFALNFYTAGRQTKDVDFMICTSDVQKAVALLESRGYSVIDSQPLFMRLKQTGESGLLVDLLPTDEDTVDQILREGKAIDIGGDKFIVPSLRHLIAMKLHAIKQNKQRELKDLPDILTLIKENNVDTKDPAFRELCLKYGTEDTLKKIHLFMS